jgi:hypothetical protein
MQQWKHRRGQEEQGGETGPMPIAAYLTQLGRNLPVEAAERADILEEVGAHLEEQAAIFVAKGVGAEEAERRAIEAFGPAARVGRGLAAAHPTIWGPSRWVRGVGIGLVLTWVLWIGGTWPAAARDIAMHQMGSVLAPSETAFHALTLSTPLGGEAFLAYLTLGWAWLVPLLALYIMTPFTWGRRAARWWAPGLAYGLGTWLAAPWFVAYWFRFDSNWAIEAEARLILLAVPLALLASGAGALLRRRTQPLGAFA